VHGYFPFVSSFLSLAAYTHHENRFPVFSVYIFMDSERKKRGEEILLIWYQDSKSNASEHAPMEGTAEGKDSLLLLIRENAGKLI